MDQRVHGGEARRHRWRNLLVLVALFAIAVAAISGAAVRFRQEPPMVSVPDSGGAYVEAAIGNPTYLNPVLLQFNQVDRDLCSLLFSGLTRFDDQGLLAPDVAERWEVGDEGKSYTFYLRHDVRWHDRTPLTADDVVFTVKAMQNPEFQGSPEVGELWRNVGVEEVDDYTVRFSLKEAFAPFLEYTAVGILPRHLYLEATGKAMLASPYNLRPIGSGPFKLTRTSVDGLVLEPHTDYYGASSRLAQIRFRFYSDRQTALAALERGEVDGVPYLEPEDATRLAASEKLAVYSAPEYLRYAVLFLNSSTPVFKEKAVRQAVVHAIDKSRIVSVVLNGQGVPGKGPIAPVAWAFDPRVKLLDYDPKKAGELLEAAGWVDTNGDGVREKDGVGLSFVILTNDNPRHIRAGQLIAEDLTKVGFKAEVQAPSWTDLLKEYMAPRTFLAALAEQWLLTADPDIYSLWHSSQTGNGGFNFSGMRNDRADKLLEEARGMVDRGARTQLYSEFQGIWADEAPAVVLYYPSFNWAVNRGIKEIRLPALIDGSSRFRNISEWYVKTKLVPQIQ